MYLLKTEKEIIIETMKQPYELFTDSDLDILKQYNVIINRDTIQGNTNIRIKNDTANEILGHIIKLCLNKYYLTIR